MGCEGKGTWLAMSSSGGALLVDLWAISDGGQDNGGPAVNDPSSPDGGGELMHIHGESKGVVAHGGHTDATSGDGAGASATTPRNDSLLGPLDALQEEDDDGNELVPTPELCVMSDVSVGLEGAHPAQSSRPTRRPSLPVSAGAPSCVRPHAYTYSSHSSNPCIPLPQ